jgi:hypothetical protein
VLTATASPATEETAQENKEKKCNNVNSSDKMIGELSEDF